MDSASPGFNRGGGRYQWPSPAAPGESGSNRAGNTESHLNKRTAEGYTVDSVATNNEDRITIVQAGLAEEWHRWKLQLKRISRRPAFPGAAGYGITGLPPTAAIPEQLTSPVLAIERSDEVTEGSRDRRE